MMCIARTSRFMYNLRAQRLSNQGKVSCCPEQPSILQLHHKRCTAHAGHPVILLLSPHSGSHHGAAPYVIGRTAIMSASSSGLVMGAHCVT
jgi:hypothetical protein